MKRMLLIFLYGYLVRAFLKLFVGITFPKTTFLKNKKPFILIANHNSHLDTLSLMASLPKKIIPKVKPVAAADYFGKNKLQSAFSHTFINALLIPRKRDREHPENDPIYQMVHALDEGFSLILFPEGTRGKPEIRQPFKRGIALLLAQRPQTEFIPVFLKGMGKSLPKGKRLILPYTADIHFGEPTTVTSTDIEAIMKQVEETYNQIK